MNYLVALCLSLAPGQPAAPVEYAGRPLTFWLDELASDSLLRKEEAHAVLAQIGVPAKDAMPRVEKLLTAKEPTVRRRAALAVWKLGGTGKHLAEIYANDLKTNDQLAQFETLRQIQLMGPAAVPALPAILAANPELTRSGNSLVFGHPFVSIIRAMGKDALPGLIDSLASEDPAVGTLAAALLPHAGPDVVKNAGPALAERLKADDATTRVRAAWALWQLGTRGERELAVFTADLERGAPELRAPVVLAMTALHPRRKELLPVYKLGLKQADVAARVHSAIAVWELTKDADAVVPTLVEVLTAGSDQAASWRHAVRLLIDIGPAGKKALPALLARFKAVDGELYPMTGAAVVAVADTDAVEPLFELAALPRARAPSPLTGPYVQSRAALALRRLGEPALKAAITRLDDKNPEVRRAACEVLALFGTEAKEAVPKLGERLADEHSDTRWSTRLALLAIGPAARAAEKQLIAATAGMGDARLIGLELLARLGSDPKAMTEIALKALDDPSVSVRRLAVVLLAKAAPKHPDIEKAVRKLLADPKTVIGTAQVIGELGVSGKVFVPDLVELFKTYDAVAACEALGVIGRDVKEAVPALIEALSTHQLMRVRLAAGSALCTLDAREKTVAAPLAAIAVYREPIFPYVLPEQLQAQQAPLLDQLARMKGDAKGAVLPLRASLWMSYPTEFTTRIVATLMSIDPEGTKRDILPILKQHLRLSPGGTLAFNYIPAILSLSPNDPEVLTFLKQVRAAPFGSSDTDRALAVIASLDLGIDPKVFADEVKGLFAGPDSMRNPSVAFAAWRMGGEAKRTIDALLDAAVWDGRAWSPNPVSLRYLAKMGAAAKPAVPRLLHLCRPSGLETELHRAAWAAVLAIDPDSAKYLRR